MSGAPSEQLAPQRFAPRLGIKREPRLYSVFLKSGVGGRGPSNRRREGPISRAGGVLAALHPLDCRSRWSHATRLGVETLAKRSQQLARVSRDSITCISFPSRAAVKHAVSCLHYCACSGGGPSLATAGGFHLPVRASILGA